MEYGAHLPLIEFESAPRTLAEICAYARRAAALGYRFLCANDHMLFTRPWLDGPTALAAALEASAYITTPPAFAGGLAVLSAQLAAAGRVPETCPNAIATMWLYVTETRRHADRVLTEVLAPLLSRPVDALRGLALPIGSAEQCAERITAFADAGAERVFVWPLADELRQLEAFRERVVPLVA